MKIAIAADHGGFELKESIKSFLDKSGIEYTDFGNLVYDKNDDYPDFTIKVAKAILNGEIDRGIVICGSGIGASVVANKFRGIRAAICHDTYSAHQSVEHDNLNVLCLGGRIVGTALANEIVQAFLNAKYSNEERHNRRLEKLNLLERENFK